MMVRASRKILAIAKWEVVRSGKGSNWKSILIFSSLALLVLFALSFNQGRFGVAQGLYKVAVSSQGYDSVLGSDPRLDPIRTTEEEALSLIRSGRVDMALTEKGIFFDGRASRSVAAMGIFRDRAKAIIEGRFSEVTAAEEPLRFRYFPIWVRISFETLQRPVAAAANPGERGSQGGLESSTARNTGDSPRQNDTQAAVPLEDPSQYTSVTPSEISPPLPFFSTLAMVALLSPTFFLSQAFANSLIRERVRTRGRVLLASPLSPAVIVVGKAIPYMIITTVSTLFIAAILKAISPYRIENPLFIDAALISALIFPATLMFFSIALVSSLFFRNFKESSILMVLLHTMLAIYLVTPSSTPVVLPISVVSPMTLALSIIEGGTISLGLSMAPIAYFAILGVMIFAIGSVAFDEESLFGNKSLSENFLDSLSRLIPRPMMIMIISAGSVMIAVIAQLIAVTLMILFVRGIQLAALIVVAALVEEGLKSLPIYAVSTRNKIDLNLRTSLRLAFYAGAGFFVAEKALLFLFIPEVTNIIPSFGVGFGGLLVVPFIIHFASSYVFTSGLNWDGKGRYWGALLASTFLHAGLNNLVIRFMSAGVQIG